MHVTNSAKACITFRPSWYYIYRRILSIASSNSKKCSLLRIRLMQGCYCDICKKRIRYNSDISFSLFSNVRAFLVLNAFRGTCIQGYRCFRYHFFRVEESCLSLRNYIATHIKTLFCLVKSIHFIEFVHLNIQGIYL